MARLTKCQSVRRPLPFFLLVLGLLTLHAGTSGLSTHARTAAKKPAAFDSLSARASKRTNSVSSSPAGCTLSFGSARTFGAGSSPSSLASADLNGDRVADLAVANFDSSDVSILLGNGDGTFASAVQLRH